MESMILGNLFSNKQTFIVRHEKLYFESYIFYNYHWFKTIVSSLSMLLDKERYNRYLFAKALGQQPKL